MRLKGNDDAALVWECEWWLCGCEEGQQRQEQKFGERHEKMSD